MACVKPSSPLYFSGDVLPKSPHATFCIPQQNLHQKRRLWKDRVAQWLQATVHFRLIRSRTLRVRVVQWKQWLRVKLTHTSRFIAPIVEAAVKHRLAHSAVTAWFSHVSSADMMELQASAHLDPKLHIMSVPAFRCLRELLLT